MPRAGPRATGRGGCARLLEVCLSHPTTGAPTGDGEPAGGPGLRHECPTRKTDCECDLTLKPTHGSQRSVRDSLLCCFLAVIPIGVCVCGYVHVCNTKAPATVNKSRAGSRVAFSEVYKPLGTLWTFHRQSPACLLIPCGLAQAGPLWRCPGHP